MTPPRCKCKVSYSPHSQTENIQWCPLHKAAEDMYLALQDCIAALNEEVDAGWEDGPEQHPTIKRHKQTAVKGEKILKQAEGRNR